MKKTLATTVLTILVLAEVVAQTNQTTMTKEEAREARKRAFMERTGGYLAIPPKGPEILILDGRAKPGNGPSRVASTVTEVLRIGIKAMHTPAWDGSAFEFGKKTLAESKGLLAVVLTEGTPKEPALSVYPEDRVAVVNVARLSIGVLEDEEREVRVVKEIWRSIGFITGVGYASTPQSVMQPVISPVELDVNEWQIINPADFNQIGLFSSKFGVVRGSRVFYRNAVKEGWAPAPTNDIQKAIWDRVKAEKAAATNAPSPAK